MSAANNLKSWMKPYLKRFVRYINRLEARLVEEERARKRGRGRATQRAQAPNFTQGFPMGACPGQALPAVQERPGGNLVGLASPYLDIQIRDPGFE